MSCSGRRPSQRGDHLIWSWHFHPTSHFDHFVYYSLAHAHAVHTHTHTLYSIYIYIYHTYREHIQRHAHTHTQTHTHTRKHTCISGSIDEVDRHVAQPRTGSDHEFLTWLGSNEPLLAPEVWELLRGVHPETWRHSWFQWMVWMSLPYSFTLKNWNLESRACQRSTFWLHFVMPQGHATSPSRHVDEGDAMPKLNQICFQLLSMSADPFRMWLPDSSRVSA